MPPIVTVASAAGAVGAAESRLAPTTCMVPPCLAEYLSSTSVGVADGS